MGFWGFFSHFIVRTVAVIFIHYKLVVWITYTVHLHKDKSSASKGQLRDFSGSPVVDLTSQCRG